MADIRDDSPDDRHERRDPGAQKADGQPAPRIAPDAVGDKDSDPQTNRYLRECDNPGNREVFSEFVQRQL